MIDEFTKRWPVYEAYHDGVVVALTKAYGEHLAFFFAKRFTYHTQFALRKTPDEVVESFREEYGR